MSETDKIETAPSLVIKANDSFLPIDFQRRDIQVALNDAEYLRERLGEDNDRVIQGLSDLKGDECDKIMFYYQLLSGRALNMDDFSNIGFFFRDVGGVCDTLMPHEIGFNAKIYRIEGDESQVYAQDYHFNTERGLLREGEPDNKELRKRILGVFNTSYCNVKKALVREFEEELGVEFEIEEGGGIFTARQKEVKYADPVYVIKGFDSHCSTYAQATVQKYRLVPDFLKILRLLKGEPVTSGS